MSYYVTPIQPNQPTINDATALVKEKFAAVSTYASEAYNKALEFLDEIIDIVDDISDVTIKVALDPINLTPSIDITSYIRDIPIPPSITYPSPPINTFSYTEDEYVSSLLSSLKDKLSSILSGTGILDSSVEDAIFQREKERDELALQDAKDRLASDWAERNLELPGGGLFNTFLQADVEYLNKRLDKSRAIAEETRKIEVENIRLALQESRQIENALMDYKSKYWDRKLDAAKTVFTYALEVFKASIEIIKTKSAIYSAEVSAFASYIGALVAAANVEVAVIKGKVEYAVAEANIEIEEIKAKIEQMKTALGIGVTATGDGAKVASQLAASALSAVSAGASISAGASQALNYSSEARESWNISVEEES